MPGNSGSGGSYNKVGKGLLFGLGAVLVIGTVISLLGPRNEDDGPEPPDETVTPAPTTVPEQRPAQSSAPLPTQPSAVTHGEDEAVLTIVAYGLPARVSPTLQGSNDTLRGEFREPCIPDVQYPRPCITDYVVKKGSSITIHAGDSRAGFWPSLDSLKGPGCDLGQTNGPDLECTITVPGDLQYDARYYGGESPGNSHYVYPECPKQRGNNPPAWTTRCQ